MKNNILHILIKHFSGTATDEEEKAVAEWLSNTENKCEYQEYKEIWELTGKIHLFDSDKAWNKFRDNLENSGIRSVNEFRLLPLIKIAATLAIIVAIGALFYYLLKSEPLGKIKQYEFATTVEAFEKAIVLPDGSKVWLNQNSRLNISKQFGESQRRVKLEGEAYFEVAKDISKPFVIETSRSFTTILGTSFNIKTYGNETEEIISMLTGKIEFSSKASGKSIRAEAGKEVVLSGKGEISILELENQNFLAWKTHQLIFKDNYLPLVIADIERYFNVSIQIEDEELKKCRFTGTFVRPTLNDILETLSFTLELKVQQQKENLHISGKGC